MRSELPQRLLALQTKLGKIRAIIEPEKLMQAGSRRERIACFTQVAVAINRDFHWLPKRVMLDDKRNLPRELRIVSTTCRSVIQAINDGHCKTSQTVKIARRVRSQIRQLAKDITPVADRLQLLVPDDDEKPITPIVENKPTPTPEVTAAQKKLLRSFQDLEQFKDTLREKGDSYDTFIQDMRKGIKILENEQNGGGGETKSPVPTKVTEPVIPLSEEQEYIKHQLEIAHKKLPKPIKFKEGQLYDLVKSPLMVIPENFVAKNIWKGTHIKVTQLYKGGWEYIPGTTSPKVVSPLIIENQWLMAVPLNVARDPKTFNELLEYAVPALGEHVGGLMPMPIGMGVGASATPRFKGGESLITPGIESYQEKLRNKTHDKPKTIPADYYDDDFDPRVIKKINKRQTQSLLKSGADKRRFFTDKHYPGVAFVWLVLHSQYSQLHRVRFVNVAFPRQQEALDLSNGTSQQERQVERKQSSEKMSKLQKQRLELIGNIPERVSNLEKQLKKLTQEKADVIDLLTADQNTLLRQQKDIASIPQNSPARKAAEHALELTKISIDQHVGTVESLHNQSANLRAIRKALGDEIKRRIQEAKLTRNKK